MPKPVEFSDLGIVEFPDEWSQEQILAAAPRIRQDLILRREARTQDETYDEDLKKNYPGLNERTVAAMFAPQAAVALGIGPDEIVTAGANALRGLTKGIAGVPELFGRATETLPPGANLIADEYGNIPKSGLDIVKRIEEGRAKETPQQRLDRIESSPFVQLGKNIESLGEAVPRNEALSRSFLYGDLPQGAGNLAASLATAPLGPAGIYASTFGQEANDAWETEMQRQADAGESPDPDKALKKAALYGSIATAIEAKLGVGRVAKRLKQFFKSSGAEAIEASPQTLKKTLVELLKESGAGGTEEGLQQIAEDIIVDNKVNWENVGRSAAVGSIVQGPTALASHAGRAVGNLRDTFTPKSILLAREIDDASANEPLRAPRWQDTLVTAMPEPGGIQISTEPRRAAGPLDVTPNIIDEPATPLMPPTVLGQKEEEEQYPRRGPWTPQQPRSVRRPVVTVPGEEEPAAERESAVETIRKANAQTIEQIRDLFPEANLTRQQAREWKRLAWEGRTPERTQVTYTPPEPAPPITPTPNATPQGTVPGNLQVQRAQAGKGGSASEAGTRDIVSPAKGKGTSQAPQAALTSVEAAELDALNPTQKARLKELQTKAAAPVSAPAPAPASGKPSGATRRSIVFNQPPVPAMTRSERDDLAALRANAEAFGLRPDQKARLAVLETKEAAINAATPQPEPTPAPSAASPTPGEPSGPPSVAQPSVTVTTTAKPRRRALVGGTTRITSTTDQPKTHVTEDEYDAAVQQLHDESYLIGVKIWGKPDRIDIIKHAPMLIQGGRQAIQEMINGTELGARYGKYLVDRGYIQEGLLPYRLDTLRRLVQTVEESNIKGSPGYKPKPLTSVTRLVSSTPELQGHVNPGMALITAIGVETGENEEGVRTTRRVNTPITFADINVLVTLDRADRGEQNRARLTNPPTVTEIGNAAVRSGSTFLEKKSATRTHLLVFNKSDGKYHAIPIWRNNRGVVVVRPNATDKTGVNFAEFMRDTGSFEFPVGKGGHPVYRMVLNTGTMFVHQTYTPQQVADMMAAVNSLMGTEPGEDKAETISRVVRAAVSGKLDAAEDTARVNESITPLYEDLNTADLAPVKREKLETIRYVGSRDVGESMELTAFPRLQKVASNLYYSAKAIKKLNTSSAAAFLAGKAHSKSAAKRMMVKSLVDEARRQLTEAGYFLDNPNENKIHASYVIASRALAEALPKSRRVGGRRFATDLSEAIARMVTEWTTGSGSTAVEGEGTAEGATSGSIKERTVSGLKAGLTQWVESEAKAGHVNPEQLLGFRHALEIAESVSELQEVGRDLSMVLAVSSVKLKTGAQPETTEETPTTLRQKVEGALFFPDLRWSQLKDGSYFAPATADMINWMATNKRATAFLGITTGKDKFGRSLVLAKEVPGTQTRYSYGVRIANPMSVKQVEDAVKKALGVTELPKNITVVEAPGTLTRIWKGKVTFGPEGPHITLNAAFLGSSSEVFDTLVEEGLHIAFQDESVRDAWEEVLSKVDRDAVIEQTSRGYDSHVAVEEAANGLVRQVNATAEGRNAWQRFVDAVLSFINRTFGINLGGRLDPNLAQKLVARAILMARGDLTVTGTGTAYSQLQREIDAVKEVRNKKGQLLAPNYKPSNLNEYQWRAVRTPSFKAWFGDWENDTWGDVSKVLDENLEPMVMYHGTPNPDFNTVRPFAEHPSKPFEWGPKGFYTSPRPSYAGQFSSSRGVEAGAVYPVFLNIRNPAGHGGQAHWETESGQDRRVLLEAGDRKMTRDEFIELVRMFDGHLPPSVWVESGRQRSVSDSQTGEIYDALNRKPSVLDAGDFTLGTAAIKVLGVNPDDGYLDLDNQALRSRVTAFYKRLGYDGLFRNEVGGLEIVAFDPNQVKSATGNKGTFSSESNDIRYSIPKIGQKEYQRAWDLWHAYARLIGDALFPGRTPDQKEFGGKNAFSEIARGTDLGQKIVDVLTEKDVITAADSLRFATKLRQINGVLREYNGVPDDFESRFSQRIPYGYWVAPDGSMTAVGGEYEHATVAKEIFERLFPDKKGVTPGLAQTNLYHLGYARAVYRRGERMLHLDTFGRDLTPRQVSAVKDFSIENQIHAYFEGYDAESRGKPRWRKSIHTAETDDSDTRYSLVEPSRLVFDRPEQVAGMAATPGLTEQQVGTVKAAGSAQAGLVDQNAVAQIAQWRGSKNNAEYIAGHALAPIIRYSELGGKQPWMVVLNDEQPGSSVNQQLPENQSVAAHAVIRTDQSFQKVARKLEKQKAHAAEQLETAVALLPDAQVRDIEGGFAAALADELVAGMAEQLKNLASLSPTTISAEQMALLKTMTDDLQKKDSSYKSAIGTGILNIATQIPEGVLAGTEAVTDTGAVVPAGTEGTKVGAQSVINWVKAQHAPPVAGEGVGEWLTTGTDVLPSPLEAYPQLMENLLRLRGIVNNREAALRQVKAFKDWFFDNKPKAAERANSVTLLQFANKYRAWRNQNREAAELVRKIKKDVRKWDDQFRGFSMAVGELDRMMKTPAYQDQVKQAVDHLHASETDISVVDGSGKLYAAKGPLRDFPKQDRYIDYTQTEDAAKANSATAAVIADAIQKWYDSDEAKANPAAVAAWKREQEWLALHGMMHAAVQANYGQIGTRLFGITSQLLMAVGFAAPKQGIKRMLGRHAQIAFGKAVNNWGIVSSGLDDIFRNKEYGWFAMQDAVIKAAKSHDEDVKTSEIYTGWLPMFSKIVARNQSAGGTLLTVGDRLPNGQLITKEDMEAARVMKRNTDAIRNFISKNPQFQEILESPLQIVDDDSKAYRDDVAPSYLLVVPRTFSSPGLDFVRKWTAAKAREATVVDDEGNKTVTTREREELLNADENIVNDYWSTSNPEFLNGSFFRGDDLVRKAHKDRIAAQKVDRGIDLSFHNEGPNKTAVDNYAAWIGGLRAKSENSDTVTETAKAKQALIDQIDAYVDAVARYSAVSEKEAKVENESSPVAVFANTGRGPLTTPRGQMVAPDFFYDYTHVTHVNYSNLRGKALLPFIVRVHHELNAISGALKNAIKEKEEHLKTLVTPGAFKGFRSRRALRKEEIRKAQAGGYVASLKELKVVQRMVDAEKSRLAINLGKAKDTLLDSTSIDIARRAESFISLPLLASESATVNNAMSAVFGAALLDVMAGNTSWYYRFPMEYGKLHVRVMKSMVTTVAGNKTLDRVFKKYPRLFNKFSELILKWTLQEARMAAITNNAGVGTTLNVLEHIRAIKRNPETYGDLESREVNNMQKLANRAMSFLSGWQIGKTTVPGLEGARNWSQLVDNFTLKQVALRIVQNVDRIQKAMYDAMEARSTGETRTENWNNRLKDLTPFTPKELGLSSFRELEAIRRFFGPAGNLEVLALDYWNNVNKEATQEAKDAVSLLSEAQQNSVVREMFRFSGNPVDEANRITRFGATGNIGFLYQTLFRFQNWAANMSSTFNALTERDLRDKPSADLFHILRVMALMMIAAFVAIFGTEEKAGLRLAISNDEPSVPRLAGAQGAGDYVRLAVSSMASGLVPYYGELLARAMGTSANKPLFDLTGAVPLAGWVNRAIDTATKIVQSDDPLFPLVDFVRNTMPYARPFIGLAERAGVEPLAGEAMARQASRAIRSAAPADWEKTAIGGGVGGKQTPMTGIMRRAIAAAYSGNEEELKNQIEQAVAYKVEQGQSETDARASVLQSIESRVPARRVLGKLPTPEEEQTVVSRMTDSQKAAYEASRKAFSSASEVVGHPIPVTAPGSNRQTRRTFGSRRISTLRRGIASRGRRGPSLPRLRRRSLSVL